MKRKIINLPVNNEREDKKKIKKDIITESEEVDGCGCYECDTPLLSSPSTKSSSVNFEEIEEKKEKNKNKEAKILIIIGIALTIPLVITELLEFYHILGNSIIIDYFLLSLATPVQILLGRPFYKRFYNSLKKRRGFTIDTLVVLSTSVAYVYSLIAMLTNQDVRFFEASASVLTIFTIGEYIERKVLGTTSESIKSLLALKPKTAIIIKDNGKQETVNVDDIVKGDVFVVKPGENIATDGIIVYGESSIDESMITGESILIDKRIGDKVIGGTINKNGYLHVRATNVGSQTVLSTIIEMVKKARANKPSIQRIADRCAKYFIPVVFTIAVVSSLYWLLVAQTSIQFVITVFATVLVVSCPCALGIATPMVVSLGIGKAAKQGILIKGGKYLEKLASVDTVVFDKTGTLTKGKLEVTDIIPNTGYDEYYVLQLASSAEIKSEHPIAQAIVKKASERKIPLYEVQEFSAITGYGIVAKYQEQRVFVLSSRTNSIILDNNNNKYNFMQSKIIEKFQSKIFELESEGKTVVTVFSEDKLIGIIAVADIIRENAIQIVKQIQSMGKEIILLSGDNKRTVNAIARKLNIKNVLAEVLPHEKAEKIKHLQKDHTSVAMVGDGINDAPALTQSDIGIVMRSGTDIAMDAGHIILMKNNLSDIIYAFKLADYSLKKIKQNLTISFAYNSITIPIAAGLLYGITNSLILTPALAAIGWVISDSLVFGNSLLLKKFVINKKNFGKDE
jgi:Cu+-exporting ATPase